MHHNLFQFNFFYSRLASVNWEGLTSVTNPFVIWTLLKYRVSDGLTFISTLNLPI